MTAPDRVGNQVKFFLQRRDRPHMCPMASIRSRNGRYQVQVRRSGLGSRSRTFVLKQDAERWARKMEAQFDQGEFQQLRTKDNLLHDLIDRYRREITPSKKSRDTEEIRLARLMRDPIASLTEHIMAVIRLVLRRC